MARPELLPPQIELRFHVPTTSPPHALKAGQLPPVITVPLPLEPPELVLPLEPPELVLPLEPPELVLPLEPPELVLPLEPPELFVPLEPPEL